MKIISDLPDYIVIEIRQTIADGKYKSISDFIQMATENQLALESGKMGTLIDASKKNNEGFIKDFSLLSKEFPFLETKKVDSKGDNIWDNWLWGQINRIFPIKFAARILAIESSKLNYFPEIENFNNTVSKLARELGIFLSDMDLKLKKERDKKLSTGFPVGKKVENSLNRYWSQFVGYQKQDKTVTGALFDLAFANLFTDEKGVIRIGLNSQGKKFSQLENPILDCQDYLNTLSDSEILFYLDHIKTNVPGEFSLISMILKLLNRGPMGREELNEEIALLVEGSGWTEGLISTQRAGAISRLYELGMIFKKRFSHEVQYHITEKGKEWLE
jgi:Arc/MetJ-type ribon-helix-helix transcriptional regulator